MNMFRVNSAICSNASQYSIAFLGHRHEIVNPFVVSFRTIKISVDPNFFTRFCNAFKNSMETSMRRLQIFLDIAK